MTETFLKEKKLEQKVVKADPKKKSKEVVKQEANLSQTKADLRHLEKKLAQMRAGQIEEDKHTMALNQAVSEVQKVSDHINKLSETQSVTDANDNVKVVSELFESKSDLKDFKAPKPTQAAQIISGSDDLTLAQVASHSTSRVTPSRFSRLFSFAHTNTNQDIGESDDKKPVQKKQLNKPKQVASTPTVTKTTAT